MNKAALRQSLRQRRDAISPEEHRRASAALGDELLTWLCRASGTDTLFLFAPHQSEPDLFPVLPRLGSFRLALPRVESGGGMAFHAWSPEKPLAVGRYGIREPDPSGERLHPGPGTVIVVPCLAVDHAGYRLGYGGGYYDRYLERHPARTLGVVFSPFVLPELPRDGWDRALSQVITPEGVLMGDGG